MISEAKKKNRTRRRERKKSYSSVPQCPAVIRDDLQVNAEACLSVTAKSMSPERERLLLTLTLGLLLSVSQ